MGNELVGARTHYSGNNVLDPDGSSTKNYRRTKGTLMTSICPPARYQRIVGDGDLLVTVAEQVDASTSAVTLGPGVTMLTDHLGHVTALRTTDRTMVVGESADSELRVVFTYEPETDMAYLYLGTPWKHRITRTIERCDGTVLLDLGETADLIGIEFFSASEWFCANVLQNASQPGDEQ